MAHLLLYDIHDSRQAHDMLDQCTAKNTGSGILVWTGDANFSGIVRRYLPTIVIVQAQKADMTFLLELLSNFRHPPSFRSFSSQPLIFNASSRGFFQHLGTVTERCASQPRQAPSRDTQLFPRRPKQLELTGGGVSMAPVPMPVTVTVSVSLCFAKRFVSRNSCLLGASPCG